MRFQLSNIRKIYDSIFIAGVVSTLIYIILIGARNYIIFIFLSIVIFVYGLLYKSSKAYIIEKNNITVTNNKKQKKIYIKDILYIENCTRLNSAYGQNGVGVSEKYYIITNMDRYKIDGRLKNNSGNNLVEELKNKYNKKIKVRTKIF